MKFPQELSAAFLPLQTTALDRASPQSTTRCVRASSQVSCAQRRCAVRQWAGRGVTPVRCARLSRIPVGEASSQTTALGLAKVKSSFFVAQKQGLCLHAGLNRAKLIMWFSRLIGRALVLNFFVPGSHASAGVWHMPTCTVQLNSRLKLIHDGEMHSLVVSIGIL